MFRSNNNARICLVLLLVCVTCITSITSPVHAWNYTTSLKRDKRIAVVLGVFGHSEFGKTQVQIKNLLLQPVNEKSVSAVSFTAKTWIELRKVKSASVAKKLKKQIEKEDDGTCADVENIDLEEMSTPMRHFLKYLKAPPMEDEDDLKATVTFTVKEAGLYALVYARCIAPATTKVVSSAPVIKVSQYNPKYEKSSGESGGISVGSTFLSIGETPLPMIYGGFAVLFAVGSFLWYRELSSSSSSSTAAGGNGVMRVHYAMLIVGILKCLTLFLESGVYAHRNTTGGTGATVDVIFVMVSAIKTAILFVIVILLGTGWSISKAFVSEFEQKLIWGVLVVQLIVNIALATLEEGNPIGSDKVYSVRLFLRVMDLVCALLILIPIINRAKSQHEAAVHRQNAEAFEKKNVEMENMLKGREELVATPTTTPTTEVEESEKNNNTTQYNNNSLIAETPEKIVIVEKKKKNNPSANDEDDNDDDDMMNNNNKEIIRLKTFRSFYIATFVFLYFTRLVVPYLENHLSYLFLWVPHLLYELAAFIFYYVACYLFQPTSSSSRQKASEVV